MRFEIGERVIFRSLEWEVQDNSSQAYIELFGRSRLNRGKIVRALFGVEPLARAEMPSLSWAIGSAGWDPLMWKALHDAYRLTLAHGRGNLSSVDWGRLVLEPYQLVPLQRIENLPFPRLLIADDTGLGKTAEAGLILFRLMQRRRAERVLILTRARPEPERWQREMREKFGIEMQVVSGGQDYARLRRNVPAHLNVFGYVPRMIMSMHFAAQSHIVSDLRRNVRWDVVIVDEAHHLAERGSGTKALTELGRVVAESSEALLLLTATPHDGKAQSFASLLQFLDQYAVVDPDSLDPAIVRPLIVRRLKTQVVKGDNSRFVRREIIPLDVESYRTDQEKSLERALRAYTRSLQRQAEQLKIEGEQNRAMGVAFLETFLRKRLASSAYACGISLINRLRRIRGEYDVLQESEEITEDISQQAILIDAEVLPDGRTEEQILLDLIEKAKRIPEGQEGKVTALVKLLERKLSHPTEKVIIFTEFRDTLEMLKRVLIAQGWQDILAVYHGDTSANDRQDIQRRFREDPNIRIFLGTDAASEGINLQESCNVLVHMEIPWNPNKYEQRNGRIDRYGQTQQPEIYLLIATKSLEQRMAQIVIEKLENIADQLGSVSNVFPLTQKVNIDEYLSRVDEDTFEEQIEELSQELDASINTTYDELQDDGAQQFIRGETFDEQDMRLVRSQLLASQEFSPDYHDIREFLETFFRVEDGQLHPTAEKDVFRVIVPHRLQQEVGVAEIPRATFQRDIALAEKDREDGQRVEFLSPGHVLVQAALRRARGWVYTPGFKSRMSYRRVSPESPAGFMFTFATRFVDGRGETIEERFEPVFVDLDMNPNNDADADLRWFAERIRLSNLQPGEQQALQKLFHPRFEEAQRVALMEVKRRQVERAEQLKETQDRIAEDALIRLGRWKHGTEDRLRRRMEEAGLGAGTQMDLFGLVARRLRRFRDEQELLLKQEQERREGIRAMKRVRPDSVDLIGTLVMIPEGMSI